MPQVQNEQIRRLEAKVRQADKSRTAYEDVTMMIRRLWDRLNDDLAHLCKQSGVPQVRTCGGRVVPSCTVVRKLLRRSLHGTLSHACARP